MLQPPYEYTVTDSGPIDGVTVTERRFEFRLKRSGRVFAWNSFASEEHRQIYKDDTRYWEYRNENAVMTATMEFYRAIAAI